MKKLVVIVLMVGAGFYFMRRSAMCSYASTLWSQVRTETKNAVPTRFEISRARHEIANLDDDIGGMIRPIAEYKATIASLKKEIDRSETALGVHKAVLLSMTNVLEGSPTVLVYAGEEYSADRVLAPSLPRTSARVTAVWKRNCKAGTNIWRPRKSRSKRAKSNWRK